jgi:magnesium chelatase family protein
MIRLVAKRLPAIGALSTVSPIEASHHPRSVAALVGGQLGARPGAVSLAHAISPS